MRPPSPIAQPVAALIKFSQAIVRSFGPKFCVQHATDTTRNPRVATAVESFRASALKSLEQEWRNAP